MNRTAIYLLLTILHAFAFIVNAEELKFLGVPLAQDKSMYQEVLKSKRFYNCYPNLETELGGLIWENGDFWKAKKCYVSLSTCGYGNNIHHVEVNIPMPDVNVSSWEEYETKVRELIADFTTKYGDKFSYSEEDKKDGKFASCVWEMLEGTITVRINLSRMWAVIIDYETATIINARKEAQRYRGEGIDDL